jgi:hypothetical protein
MECYCSIRKSFEEDYLDYQKKLEIYNIEYEKVKVYLSNGHKPPKELMELACTCSKARVKANESWNICLSHPLHHHFKGYTNPEVNQKYGIK